MAVEYLLDAGIANLLALNDAEVQEKLADAGTIIPIIVVGELYYGAYQYAHRHQSTKFLDIYDDFVAKHLSELLFGDLETAHIYGTISAELQAKGRPMQQNDMWIAALARQYGLTLLTQDSDFTRASSLDYELWPRV